MVIRKKILFVLAIAALLLIGGGTWLYERPGCSISYRFRPDVTCHVLDVRGDGTYLLESFDADTNDLRLYVQQKGIDTQIEHPYGKVKLFSARLQQTKLSSIATIPRH